MSISDGSDPYLFCRKMEKTRSVKEEMDGKLFISRQSRHPFPLVINMIKVLFPIRTLIWRAKKLYFLLRKGINRRKKVQWFYKLLLWVMDLSLKITFDCLNRWNSFPQIQRRLFLNTKPNKLSLHHWQDFSSRSMATLRNKRKLAAVSREAPEGSRSSRTQNVLDPELTQDYISQVSKEIEGRVTKKLSKEVSKTESRILGALSKLDEFFWTHKFGLVPWLFQEHPETLTWKTGRPLGIAPQTIPTPKWGIFLITLANSIAQRQKPTLTWWQEKQKEIRQYPHMMTATQEEIPYCSPTTSSGKQKKARSTSQPQFCSENTPATIEADQTLLALQQLATNSNSANFHNNISRISKLSKSITTALPTFDGKSEKIQLFEDLFQTNLKIHKQLTEADKKNYFHSLMRGDALLTFKNINSPNRENLGQILTVFRRKYVKPQSMATAKHKFQRLVFNSAKKEVKWFSRWTPAIGKRRIRSCSSSDHRAIHLCQNASSPEEIN